MQLKGRHVMFSDTFRKRLLKRPKRRLTQWSGVLLEKLTVTQPVKKLPAFYGTLRFITVYTTARHWTLSRAR
jgi:hypothetical protein